MKKVLFQIALLLIPFACLQAQLQIGLAGSINGRVILNQNNYGFSEMEYKPVVGAGYGLALGYQFGGKHSINLEFNAANLGQAYEETIGGELLFKDAQLKYWQIPLVLNLGINKAESKNRIYISLGGYYGILSNANIDWKIDGTDVTFVGFHENQNRNPNIDQIKALLGNSNDPADYKDLFNKADYGVILGIGAKWKLSGNLSLITELRGGYGLADINDENWVFTPANETYKKSNNAFGGLRLGLNYSFASGDDKD